MNEQPPIKEYVIKDVESVKDMDIKLGEYDVSLKNNYVIDYKNIKDEDENEIIKMIKTTANLPSLKISLGFFNKKQITADKYVEFRDKYWIGNNPEVPEDILNSLKHNRFTRYAQLGSTLGMSNDILIEFLKVKQEQINAWREKFYEIMDSNIASSNDNPEKSYKKATLREKENIATDLDALFKDIYEKSLKIKSENELFNKSTIRN
jgi:hypothetical protein